MLLLGRPLITTGVFGTLPVPGSLESRPDLPISGMPVEPRPPHMQSMVDAYRWRAEKPQVFTFEHDGSALGGTSMTLAEAQPSPVTEVLVLAHVVDLHDRAVSSS